MEEIDNRYTRQKLKADHSLLLTTSVKRIQRKFRWTMRFLSNSQSRIRKTGFLSLNLRAFWVRGSTRKDAKKLIQDMFLKKIIHPKRCCNLCIGYIVAIQNIQQKMINHIKVKKRHLEQIENQWNKQILKLVDQQANFTEMGINFNTDAIKWINKDTRDAIFNHIVDRKLLEYTDLRFERMMLNSDVNINKKVVRMSFLENQIEEDEKNYSRVNPPKKSI